MQIIKMNGESYCVMIALIEQFTDDEEFDKLKERCSPDIVLKKDGTLYLCRKIQDVVIIEESVL